MIEIQIRDEQLYCSVKQYAEYSSDLTRVCSFRDEMAPLLQEVGIQVEVKNPVKKELPVLTIKGKNIMELKNAPAEMLHYVGVRSEYDPTIAVTMMHEVSILVENHLVQCDERFKELYGKLGYRGKIQQLVCASVKFYGKGKLLDFIDGGLSIQSLNFPDCKTKSIPYKQLRVKITELNGKWDDLSLQADGDVVKHEAKWDEVHGFQCDSQGAPMKDGKIIIRFYQRPIILRGILFKGNRINILCPKISETDGSLLTYDPIIIPDGLKMREDVMITPPNRKIPALLYRNAYDEFKLRYNYESWGGK